MKKLYRPKKAKGVNHKKVAVLSSDKSKAPMNYVQQLKRNNEVFEKAFKDIEDFHIKSREIQMRLDKCLNESRTFSSKENRSQFTYSQSGTSSHNASKSRPSSKFGK